MTAVFYISGAVAVLATIMTITRLNAMHALLYFIVSLLALAAVFFTLGAPFAAVLEVIVYAGAIIVLFVFAVMMLNLGDATIEEERRWLWPQLWIGPSILCAILLVEMLYVLGVGPLGPTGDEVVGAEAVGLALFGPYLLAVEIASMLLLAGLVGSWRLAQRLEARHAEVDAPESAAEAAVPEEAPAERERAVEA
ncbi:MAG TPA: NADH-quinone oxidoreductase subunit J [Gammaproteobacteria bacterium]